MVSPPVEGLVGGGGEGGDLAKAYFTGCSIIESRSNPSNISSSLWPQSPDAISPRVRASPSTYASLNLPKLCFHVWTTPLELMCVNWSLFRHQYYNIIHITEVKTCVFTI